MKRTWMSLALLGAMSLTLSACTEKESEFKVGILQFVSHGALDAATAGIQEAFATAGWGTDKVTFTVVNPQTDAGIMATMSKDLLRTNDLVIGIATPAAISLVNEAENENINIPILFTAVTDPISAGLVASRNAPGANVTGSDDMNPVADQIALAKELLPSLDKIGIVYTSSEVNSQVQVDLATTKATELGIEVATRTITSTNEIQQAVNALITSDLVDLLYLPTDNLVASAMEVVAASAREHHIPTVCGESSMVEKGGLVTLGIDYKKLGILTGNMALAILKGEKEPASFPVASLTDLDLVVNQKEAAAVGFTIPQAIIDRAKRVIS